MSIQLKFTPRLRSIVALENVLLRGNKITSSTVYPDINPMLPLHQLLMHSKPSMEQLHIYADRWRVGESAAHEIWPGFPSASRNLFADTPFLSITPMLRTSCTWLWNNGTIPWSNQLWICSAAVPYWKPSSPTGAATRTQLRITLVSLPHLRGIELGASEVQSGLITYLQFPPNVAVGFRTLFVFDICGEISSSVTATMQHVLRRADIRYITLAAPPFPQEFLYPARFEGPGGPLEITIVLVDYTQVRDIFFKQGGVLFCHSPRIGNVKELHIVGCPFEDDRGLDHVSAAMPNLISISFFDCLGLHVFGSLLTPTDPSSPPFPHLEGIMVLGQESELTEMAQARRNFDVPLKTVVIGRGPRGSEPTATRRITLH